MTGPAGPGRADLLLSGTELQAVVGRLAREISVAYPGGVVLVGVLKGSAIFLADLIRSVTVAVEVDFVAVAPFEPGGVRARLVKDLDQDIAGRAVVVVEDIVDTGLTLTYLLGELRVREPASLEVCTLVDKATRRLVPVPLRFVGLEAPDRFLLGYGLDFAGRYRNLDLLAAADGQALFGEPDLHLAQLYDEHRSRRSSGGRTPEV